MQIRGGGYAIMTIVEHVLVGGMIGLSVEPFDAYILTAALGGSLLPDIDVAYGCPGTLGYLDKHRTYTHSLLLAPLFSLLLSLIFYGGSFLLNLLLGLQPVDSVLSLWPWCFLGFAVHLLMDILNPFGTALWWPKKDRVAADILFEFDAAFLILFPVILLIVWEHFLPDRIGPAIYHISLITVLVLMIYLLWRFMSRIEFKKKIKDDFDYLLKHAKKASFVPAGLWRWKAILETEDKHYVIRKQRKTLNCEVKLKTIIPCHMQVKEVDTYKKYARHLDVHVKNERLILSNLVYSSKVYPLIGCFAGPGKPLIKIGKPKWLRVLCERRY